MNACPCCSNKLLRHVRQQNVYWFCTYCRQEMPNFEGAIAHRPQRQQKIGRAVGISVETPV